MNARICPYCPNEELDDGYCHECEWDCDTYEDVLRLINDYRELRDGKQETP